MDDLPERLSPALSLAAEGAEAASYEPALGGLREVLAIARRAPARAARLEALIRLGQQQDPQVYAALAEASADPDWVARKYAVSGLGALRLPGALPIVLAGLADAHVEVRRAAARALKLLDDGHRLPEWLLAAKDADHLVRAAAQAGLARYPDESATAALLGALTDGAWLARYLALDALLPRVDERIVPAFLEIVATDPALAPHAARELGRRAATSRDAILPGLLAQLPNAPPWRRLAVAAALGTIDDPEARQGLAALIGHPDPEIEDAILAQGLAITPHLCDALSDPAWTRRWHACQLLGRLGDLAVAVSVRPLVHDPRPEVRLAAIAALGCLVASEAATDLIVCARDQSWRVRLAAIQALSALHRAGTPGLRPALLAASGDARDEVRNAVALALGGGQAGAPTAS